jgi:transposase InsO family protein
VNKFTKWIKAKLAVSIIMAKAVKFVKEIMYQFGVPNNIITDNGAQITAREFKDLGIKKDYTLVSHPQSNGQVECSNGMILQGFKPRIFDRINPYAGKWVKELPSVLWTLCTNPSHATGHTLFLLVYRSLEFLPIEVEHKSFRIQ